MNRLKNIPLILFANITKTKRFRPRNILWTKGDGKLIVSDFFRVLEQVFGRKDDGRPRLESLSGIEVDDNGNKTEFREFYTFESILCHLEGEIRRWWREGKLSIPNYLHSPRLAEVLGFAVSSGRFAAGFYPMLAVVYDVASSGNNNTSGNTQWNHTNGGSVGMLVICAMGRNTPSSINYAGNGTTFVNSINGSSNYNLCQYQGNPSTGTNQVDIAWTSGTFQKAGIAISFSGALTTVGVSNNNAGNSTAPSQTLTGIALTSLVVNFVQHNQGTLPSGVTGSGVTQRLAINPANTCAVSTTVPSSSTVVSGWTITPGNIWVTISVEILNAPTTEVYKSKTRQIFNDPSAAFSLILQASRRIMRAGAVLTGIYNLNVSENVTLTDSKLITLGKTLTETLNLTDSIATQKVMVLNLAEGITLSDSIVRTVGKTLAETLSLTDSKLATVGRTFTESLSLSDSILVTGSRSLNLEENIQLFDSMQKTNFLRLSETLNLTDVFQFRGWVPRVKPTAGPWTPRVVPTDSWTARTKPTAGPWTPRTKPPV